MKLVRKMEEWFGEEGAEYAHMATEKDNAASIELFTGRCGYTKFRTPSILVHPVFAHRLRIPRRVSIVRLHARDAEALYGSASPPRSSSPRRRRHPRQPALARHLRRGGRRGGGGGARVRVPVEGGGGVRGGAPGSWAVASVWDCGGVFRLEVRGRRGCGGGGGGQQGGGQGGAVAGGAGGARRLPALRGLVRLRARRRRPRRAGRGGGALPPRAQHGAGPRRRRRHRGRRVRAPARAIPHWRRLSCAEDLWCAKRLSQVPDDDDDDDEDEEEEELGDWTKSAPAPSIFVDPREYKN
uniref:N-acetyltransferase domain-containing protein n=1 Tax=Ananas comosus var. bracteatus TaxID=296719 RepID=A0A6V7Q4A4_ANACO|nr:unnamed protein product [Ananas comosus var. bracteatus]